MAFPIECTMQQGNLHTSCGLVFDTGVKRVSYHNECTERDTNSHTAVVFFVFFGQVHVVASLPCYSPKNVNMQRGSGVFDRSIKGIMKLNALGYGQADSDLKLDLVYNPVGGFLPPEQVSTARFSTNSPQKPVAPAVQLVNHNLLQVRS